MSKRQYTDTEIYAIMLLVRYRILKFELTS